MLCLILRYKRPSDPFAFSKLTDLKFYIQLDNVLWLLEVFAPDPAPHPHCGSAPGPHWGIHPRPSNSPCKNLRTPLGSKLWQAVNATALCFSATCRAELQKIYCPAGLL